MIHSLRNNFNFGWLQSGEEVNHVNLPTYVQTQTPEEMVFIFRQALESDYVSNNLNKWVDLVFGIKSGTGKEAIKACNLFHKLTYSHTLKELSEDADEKTM